jgi:hypothetical protein
MPFTAHQIQQCFEKDRVFYSRHARNEMLSEEFGPIADAEIAESLRRAEIIETYPDDTPYPSALIFGFTDSGRPLHTVCAFNSTDELCIVVTVYEPDPDFWTDFKVRKRT